MMFGFDYDQALEFLARGYCVGRVGWYHSKEQDTWLRPGVRHCPILTNISGMDKAYTPTSSDLRAKDWYVVG
jgi:hypothetical protein